MKSADECSAGMPDSIISNAKDLVDAVHLA